MWLNISGRNKAAGVILVVSMRGPLIAAIAACCLLGAAATASADVQLTLQDGRVTLIAKDATLRQILAEWARVGQTRIVNLERVPGGPLTLELRDVTEQQALKVLLRPLGGYVTAARTDAVPNLSMFDRILVMPVTAPPPAPASAGAPPPPSAPFANFQPPQFQPAPQDDDDTPPGPVPQPPGGNRAPVFVFPPPGGATGGVIQGQIQGQQPPPPNQPVSPVRAPYANYPGAPTTAAPVGSSAPGMLVPAPAAPQPPVPGTVVPAGAQPGQPVFPVQPRQ
jgi:hypothetical protein